MCKKYGNNNKEIVHKWHKLEIRGEIYDKSLFKVDEVFKDLITLGRELNPDFWVILYVALCHGMIMCLIYVIESSRMLLYYSNVDFVLAERQLSCSTIIFCSVTSYMVSISIMEWPHFT